MHFSQDNTETKLCISKFPEITFFQGYKFSRIFRKTAKISKINTREN